jgi:hypothetical protein
VRHAVRRRTGLASGSASNKMRQGRMVTLAALADCGGAVTAPSSKAGNDCDAFLSTTDGARSH